MKTYLRLFLFITLMSAQGLSAAGPDIQGLMPTAPAAMPPFTYDQATQTATVTQGYTAISDLVSLVGQIKEQKPSLTGLDFSWAYAPTQGENPEPLETLLQHYDHLDSLDMRGWATLTFIPFNNLKVLKLRYSGPRGIRAQDFPMLEILDLCHARGSFAEQITDLPTTLKQLHLEDVAVGPENLPLIGSLSNLEELSLSWPLATDIMPLRNLLNGSLPKLKVLNMSSGGCLGSMIDKEASVKLHENLKQIRPGLTFNVARGLVYEHPMSKPPAQSGSTAEQMLASVPEIAADIYEDYMSHNAKKGCVGFLEFAAITCPFECFIHYLEGREQTPAVKSYEKNARSLEHTAQRAAGFVPSSSK